MVVFNLLELLTLSPPNEPQNGHLKSDCWKRRKIIVNGVSNKDFLLPQQLSQEERPHFLHSISV